MAKTKHAGVDRIDIVGATDRGLRSRKAELAALGVPMICPPRFVVLLIEDDGCQTVIHDTSSYAEAVLEAECAGADWQVPVLDRVVE